MNRRTINAVIFLGLVSLMSILFVQYYWIKKTIATQERDVAIQEKEDSLMLKQFSEQAHIALRNVLQEISTQFSDSSDLYGAVKQVRTNYFSVDINEELHPYYLETLLKREFYNQSIHQNFQYTIAINIFTAFSVALEDIKNNVLLTRAGNIFQTHLVGNIN